MLVNYRDSILKQVSEPFDFKNPPFDPIEFSQELVKTMYESGAICLAAIQVGIPYRIFAMRGSPENFVCFNPKMVMPSDVSIRMEETSVTTPGLTIKILRPQHVKVRFATPNSEVRTETFTGMTARAFQQSLDFLDGIDYTRKANPIHRSQALRKWKRP
jgi:peptide deformylase